MLRAVFLGLLLLVPLSTNAQQSLDGPAFSILTEGKTFVFSLGGEPYGAEQYLPGNRVYWSFLDGRCLAGSWREQAGKICFAYEDRPGEFQCWEFWQNDTGLTASLSGPGSDGNVYSAQPSDEILYCMGPDAGV